MAFIERAQDGTIKGVYGRPQPGYAEEEIPDDDPAVLAFQTRPAPEPRNLAAEIDALAAKLARAKAIEDAAVKKGVLTRAEVDAEVKPVSAEVVRG